LSIRLIIEIQRIPYGGNALAGVMTSQLSVRFLSLELFLIYINDFVSFKRKLLERCRIMLFRKAWCIFDIITVFKLDIKD
jgi:hypothetical protein